MTNAGETSAKGLEKKGPDSSVWGAFIRTEPEGAARMGGTNQSVGEALPTGLPVNNCCCLLALNQMAVGRGTFLALEVRPRDKQEARMTPGRGR